MSDLVKHTFRFVLFILLQALVLQRIPFLHKFITPYLYYLFIIWLPFNTRRGWLTLIGFLFGLMLDYFMNTPGLHAAACTLIAYVRPFLVNLLISQQGAEQNYASPSIRSMGWAPYFTLVLILTLLHHSYLVFLEWIQIGSFLYFIMKVLATTGISLLLILLSEMLFVRKRKIPHQYCLMLCATVYIKFAFIPALTIVIGTFFTLQIQFEIPLTYAGF